MPAASRPILRDLKWQRLLLGFEGDGTLSTPDREVHLRAARAAIEDIFRPAKLRRWLGTNWRTARLPQAMLVTRAVPDFITAELNAGRKASRIDRLEFRVRHENQVVNVLRTTDAPPDIKPKDYVCYYDGERWRDIARLLIEINVTPEDGEPTARRKVRARSSRPNWHVWKPDGRHEMFAELIFDCPFEPVRARRR